MLRQRRWIEQRGIGDHLLEVRKIFLAQLTPAKLMERFQPKQCEPHFLLQIRFDRRCDRASTFGVCPEQIVDFRNVRQIEQFEEAINSATILRLRKFPGDSLPSPNMQSLS